VCEADSIYPLKNERDIQRLGALLNERLISDRFIPPKLMVDMGDNELEIPLGGEAGEEMQHRHRINAAAHRKDN
jgi:hypothetical protein